MAIAAERLHRITADVYERMAESGLLPERGIELIDGLVITMSRKGESHRRAANSLTAQFVDQRRGRYAVNAGSLSLRLGPHDEPEPDIALARVPERSSRESPRPDEIVLIVEVADSSLAFDLGEKRAKYGRAGIVEYWVVDLQSNLLHVFRCPNAEGYGNCRVAQIGETVSPAEYPEVVIDLSLVLG